MGTGEDHDTSDISLVAGGRKILRGKEVPKRTATYVFTELLLLFLEVEALVLGAVLLDYDSRSVDNLSGVQYHTKDRGHCATLR